MTDPDSDPRLDQVNPDLLDMDGNPMTLRAWAELFEDLDAKTIALDEFDRDGETLTVRTIWDGIRNFPNDPLELFHTGVGTHGDMMTVRSYPTKEAAHAGHRELVAAFRLAPKP